ncbi:MAG TPA: class E sortase [Solirubrobacteraceae bacterium]|nr:class E sortase [Solirubrobacteraceae bacterium]
MRADDHADSPRGRRRGLSALSTALIVAGALLLFDAGLTLVWQEPLSAIYASLEQSDLRDELRSLERAQLSLAELQALAQLQSQQERITFLARALQGKAKPGHALGRMRIRRIGLSTVYVQGADAVSLRKGPGHYSDTPLPGAGGTTAIAGHRTTYLAPFRQIDSLRTHDTIELTMPYGVFTYEVERHSIVSPGDLSVLRRASYDRLVLTACHPLYSAARRIVVFARLVRTLPRGPALR